MNPTAIAYALQLIDTLPGLIDAGANIAKLVQNSSATMRSMQAENRDPTQAEWDALNAHIKTLREELHTP